MLGRLRDLQYRFAVIYETLSTYVIQSVFFAQATTDPTQPSTTASKSATSQVKPNQGTTQVVQIQVITSQTGVQQGKANPL